MFLYFGLLGFVPAVLERVAKEQALSQVVQSGAAQGIPAGYHMPLTRVDPSRTPADFACWLAASHKGEPVTDGLMAKALDEYYKE